MMYDELIKRLRKWANSFCGCCKHADKKQKACDDCTAVYGSLWEAADAIEQLTKERDKWMATAKDEREAYWHWFDNYQKDVPCWIPVTERLPEDEVLCINDRQFYLVGLLYCDDVGNYICETDGEIMYDVTHWMPLPQPPESEGE